MATSETDIANAALARLGHVQLAGLVTDTSDTSKARVLMDGAYLRVRDEVVRLVPWNCLKKRVQLTGATLDAVTQATPGVVTTFGDHGFSAGEQVVFADVEGMTELNGNTYVVSAPSGQLFALVDSLGVSVATGGFTAYSGPADGTDTGRAVLKPLFGYAQMFPLPADCARALDIEGARRPWVVEGRRLMCDEGSVLDLRYIGHTVARAATDPGDHDYDALLISVMAQRLALELVEAITQSNTKKEAIGREYLKLLEEAAMVNVQEQSPKELEEDNWLLERR